AFFAASGCKPPPSKSASSVSATNGGKRVPHPMSLTKPKSKIIHAKPGSSAKLLGSARSQSGFGLLGSEGGSGTLRSGSGTTRFANYPGADGKWSNMPKNEGWQQMLTEGGTWVTRNVNTGAVYGW